ncbi:hypothetical protein CRENBAI_010764 [Crenichthys baileyi]|uniref:Uncharacterized protein n=1 Tax=Crenichthys baileyi TaxID=28760 RepID=A0AAV9QTC9_9TELE
MPGEVLCRLGAFVELYERGPPAKPNYVLESSQQRLCLYNAEWNSFPGLKEGQQDRITVVTAVTSSLAGRQNEPPRPTATEVSCS